jgi:hypothetical protein
MTDDLPTETLLELERRAKAAQEWAVTHPDEFDDMEIDVGHETIAELVACCAPGVVLALVNSARLAAERGERIAELEALLALPENEVRRRLDLKRGVYTEAEQAADRESFRDYDFEDP